MPKRKRPFLGYLGLDAGLDVWKRKGLDVGHLAEGRMKGEVVLLKGRRWRGWGWGSLRLRDCGLERCGGLDGDERG